MPWQQHHLADLFASEERIAFEETWSVYQNNIDAYCAPDASEGKVLMQAAINILTSTCVPSCLTELLRWAGHSNAEPGTYWVTSTTPTPATVPPKPSTAASNTYADPHSDSETSSTTSPEHSSKQEDSDRNYTPDYEEPRNR